MTRSQRHRVLLNGIASNGQTRSEGVIGYPDYTGGLVPLPAGYSYLTKSSVQLTKNGQPIYKKVS